MILHNLRVTASLLYHKFLIALFIRKLFVVYHSFEHLTLRRLTIRNRTKLVRDWSILANSNDKKNAQRLVTFLEAAFLQSSVVINYSGKLCVIPSPPPGISVKANTCFKRLKRDILHRRVAVSRTSQSIAKHRLPQVSQETIVSHWK